MFSWCVCSWSFSIPHPFVPLSSLWSYLVGIHQFSHLHRLYMCMCIKVYISVNVWWSLFVTGGIEVCYSLSDPVPACVRLAFFPSWKLIRMTIRGMSAKSPWQQRLCGGEPSHVWEKGHAPLLSSRCDVLGDVHAGPRVSVLSGAQCFDWRSYSLLSLPRPSLTSHWALS